MIKSIKGTKDILPEESIKWQFVENTLLNVTDRFGYNEIRTPIFESTSVFSRSIGDDSDIVNKEMYSFLDKGGDSITLRPEMTAALVRSLIQNNYLRDNPLSKLWYFGPFFRYERPQKGRQRQFHQFGCECIGSPYPEADADVIMLADSLIKDFEIKNYTLLLNTLGNSETREKYHKDLIKYFTENEATLSEDSKRRLHTNPLRVLDSKDKADKAIIKNAPVILDYLDDESKQHFEEVKKILDETGIKYEIDPFLVRGLDYYNHTVFEFRSDALGSQDSFGGGGRYDGLFEQLGGKAQPAVGFAMGVERLMLILEEIDAFEGIENNIDIYIVVNSEKEQPYAREVAQKLREDGLNVLTDLRRRKFKAQFKEANKMNAMFTAIIGEDEVKNRVVSIKEMETGKQESIEFDKLDMFAIFDIIDDE